MNATSPVDPALNQTESLPTPEEPVFPLLVVNCSVISGSSPLFVSFTGVSRINPSRVLQYRWDYDGDGLIDHASQTTGNTSHVYTVETPTTYQATLTVEYIDGTEARQNVTVEVDPVNREDWLEIRDLGRTVFAFHRNGTIYIYDKSSWISLNFLKAGSLVKSPSHRKLDSSNTRLTYDAGSRLLDVSVRFGITGRALFEFTEYLPSGVRVSVPDREIALPSKVSSGDLSFHYSPRARKNPVSVQEMDAMWKHDAIISYMLYEGKPYRLYSDDGTYYTSDGPTVFFTSGGGGGIFAEGGGPHDPWSDQGLTPYGEYFSNLEEYVSSQTGFLTILQTDLAIPGRGLDLVVKRVYAPPAALNSTDDSPASDIDYSYQDYPLAPMGKGWQLGFPWIEVNGTEPAYVHLSNGQRYACNDTGLNTTIQSGDYFKIENHTTGFYSLYTADGTRYVFNGSYHLLNVTDTVGNNVTFAYSGGKISRITDTIGREVNFSYSNGYVSSITDGVRTISYSYSNDNQLVEVRDPANRSTKFQYLNDYIVNKTEYPTGGYAIYEYSTYTNSSSTKYRVCNKLVYEDSSSLASNTTYAYDGDFYEVDKVTVKAWDGSSVNKTTVMDYSQGGVVEEVWDGDESDEKISKINRVVVESNRRRQYVQWYPGSSSSYVQKTMTYDDWGNTVYVKDFIGHESFYSYVNTNTTDSFVNGVQNLNFSDAFYSQSVDGNVHNLLVGSAMFQDGVGSPTLEAYYEYDSYGLLGEEKHLLAGQWIKARYDYDPYGNLVKVTDALNHSAFFECNSTYDSAYLTASKRLLEQDSGDINLTRRYGYNESTGFLICVVDEKGNRTDYAYDALGRVTNVTYPEVEGYRAGESAVYDDAANTVTLIDENGNMVKRIFDGLGRLVRFERFNGTSSYSNESYAYNCLGQMESMTTALGHNYTYHFDALGSVVRTVNPDDSYRETKFNYTSNEQEILDEEGRKRVLVYDWMGRLIEVKEYNETSNYYHTQYEYDEIGNLINIIDSKGRETTYYYNQENDVTNVLFPDDTFEAIDYDLVGNILWKRDRLGNFTYFEYDSLDRLVRIKYLNSSSFSGLAGWKYRKNVTISGTTAGNVANYAIKIVVQYGSGADSPPNVYCNNNSRNDFGDIRFTKADGLTLLDYWVESKTIGESATFWVEVDFIPANPSSVDIYMYYGNTGASSLSDIDSTFLLGDDFDGDSLNTEKWNKTQSGDCQFIISGGKARFDLFSGSSELEIKSNSAYDFSDDVEFMFYQDVEALGYHTIALHNFQLVDRDGVKATFRASWYPEGNYDRRISGETAYWWAGDKRGAKLGETRHAIQFRTPNVMKWIASGVRNFNDGRVDYDNYQSDSNRYLRLKACCKDGDFSLYWVVIRKYVNPEPTIQGFSSESNWLSGLSSTDIISEASFSYDETSIRLSSAWNGTSIDNNYDARNRISVETFNISGDEYFIEYQYDNASNIVSMKYPDGQELTYYYDPFNRVTKVGEIANYNYTLDDKILNVEYGNGLSDIRQYDERGRPSNILLSGNISYYGGWLDDWTYRKEITINGSTVGAQTNYQISLNISYGIGNDSVPCIFTNGKSQTDFGDIRFTSSDGFTPLDYWMEEKTDGENAIFWVEVDSIPSSPDSKEIFVYYGTSETSTSTSNGSSTFPDFFEDFEDGAINGWTLDQGSGTFEAQTSVVKHGNYSARKYQSTSTNYRHYKELNTGQASLRIKFWLRVDEKKAFMSYTDGADNQNSFIIYVSDKIDDSLDFSYYDGSHHKIIDASLDTWYKIEVIIDDSSTADVYIDDVLEANDIDPRGNPTEIDRLWLSTQGSSGGPEIYVDDYIAAKYVDPEPVIANIGNEITWTDTETDILLNLSYCYDKTGSVTKITCGDEVETYTYDNLDRLNGSTGPWSDITYSYDEVGNRLLLEEGVSSTSYAYDCMNRLTQAGSTYYSWDDNGNMVGRYNGVDTWNYTYDPGDRLTSMLLNGSVQNTFRYDAGGRRVWLGEAGGGNVTFVYSGLNVVYELVNGSSPALHFYANGLHVAENRSGTVEYYHQDHLGSTRLKTNATGDVVYESNYKPFGPSHGESGSEEYKYTGKHEDTSGLYYFGARYYDPETGRFITEDLVGGKLRDPQSQNKFGYSRNNPLRYVDKDGREYVDIYSLPTGDPASTVFAILAKYGADVGTFLVRESRPILCGLSESLCHIVKPDSNVAGASTHFSIGYKAGVKSKGMGIFGRGAYNYYKRKEVQRIFTEEPKRARTAGFTSRPPDYTIEEFVLDSSFSLYSQVLPDTSTLLEESRENLILEKYIFPSVKNAWIQLRTSDPIPNSYTQHEITKQKTYRPKISNDYTEYERLKSGG